MSMVKTAMIGMVGFALGAGAMMAPGGQKMKRQMQKQADKMAKMIRMW